MSKFTVVYDACVLYPAPLRDTLMRLALTDLFKAHWTDKIHEEWINALLRKDKYTKEKLERVRDLMDAHVKDDYFSAFVSAARSVTFVLQYVGSNIDGFDTWYKDIQDRQRADKTAKYLLEARNESLKTGSRPIAYGEVARMPNGKEILG